MYNVSKEYTDCSDKTEFVYCLQFYHRTGDLKPRHLAWVNGERIQISLLEVFDWHGIEKILHLPCKLTYLHKPRRQISQLRWPTVFYTSKKLGKYYFRYQKKKTRPHSTSNLTLTSFPGLDTKPICARNKRSFHWPLGKVVHFYPIKSVVLLRWQFLFERLSTWAKRWEFSAPVFVSFVRTFWTF